jgi:proline dehydrogenase
VTMLRNLFIGLSGNPRLLRLVSHLGNQSGLVRRFIAGATVEEALEAVRELNRRGMVASLDQLGEHITEESEACRASQAYVRLLEQIRQSGVDSNISIKLTQLGLGISTELCAANLRPILDRARELNNFVRIDMEGSDYPQKTLDLFYENFRIYGNHVGIVIQAYLYRSEVDVRQLAPVGCNVRLCKGAYLEPADRAFPRKRDVDANFKRLAETLLLSPAYTAIATHDPEMIRHSREFARKNGVERSRFEFQMLFGIRRDYQSQISAQGFKMRIYVPFGTQWAPYFMRRMAERPANLFFVLKNLIRR